MTTDSSGQAAYASDPAPEPVDDTQQSAQGAPQAVPAGFQQPPSPRNPGRYEEDAPGTEEPGSEAPPRGLAAEADGGKPSLIGDPSGYTTRWESIQVGFVDDPRSAVQEAETLVSDVMSDVSRVFQEERQQLEMQWSGGAQASTDDLRVAFQRYRDFFQRLLQV